MRNLLDLPSNLPIPEDDGQSKHLTGMEIPDIELPTTLGTSLRLREAFRHRSVLFIYPRAGSPLEPNANEELWDSIPGARGCTPQSCGFRDLYRQFQEAGTKVFGLSVQKLSVQKEFVERNQILFPVLSDSGYELTKAMNLPTFEFEGQSLIKRMALVIEGGKILKVFYPVFPPDRNASEVLDWLKLNQKP